jgi:hypothetical protein
LSPSSSKRQEFLTGSLPQSGTVGVVVVVVTVVAVLGEKKKMMKNNEDVNNKVLKVQSIKQSFKKEAHTWHLVHESNQSVPNSANDSSGGRRRRRRTGGRRTEAPCPSVCRQHPKRPQTRDKDIKASVHSSRAAKRPRAPF